MALLARCGDYLHMEEVRIPRAILEGLQEQLSMLQKTLERLTEQNREMAEQNRQKDERI